MAYLSLDLLTAKNIDTSRTPQNVVLVHIPLEEAYNTNSQSTYRQTLGYNKFILRQAPLSGDSLSAVAFLD